MFNHARTLLLNISGSNNPGEDYLGEELVPAGYAELVLPSYVQSVRRGLFGADPDRAMLNYRIRQLLTLIAQTDLQQYITDLDNRITYKLGVDNAFSIDETWEPKVNRYSGTADDVATIVAGSAERPDYTGKMFYQFNVDILSSSVVQVDRQSPPVKSQNLNFSLTNGLSGPLDLFYTGLEFYLNTTNAAPAFVVFR